MDIIVTPPNIGSYDTITVTASLERSDISDTIVLVMNRGHLNERMCGLAGGNKYRITARSIFYDKVSSENEIKHLAIGMCHTIFFK